MPGLVPGIFVLTKDWAYAIRGRMPFSPSSDIQDAAYPLIPSRDYADGKVYAFTDGALSRCKITDIQFGGWGVYVRYCEHELRLSGSKAGTSTQEMELEGVRQAVIALTEKDHGKKVKVFTDNSWVVSSIQRAVAEYRGHYNNWPKNSWVMREKKNRNLSLLVKEIVERSTPDFTFYWVKGHSNVMGNEQADKLAVAARQALKESYGRNNGTDTGEVASKVWS